jgi:hypothetical protein
VGEGEQEHVDGAMDVQVVEDRVDSLRLGRDPDLDLLQEVDPVGDRAPVVGLGEGVAGGRPEGAEDASLAAPAVVDLLLDSPVPESAVDVGRALRLGVDRRLAGKALVARGPILSRQTTVLPCGGTVSSFSFTPFRGELGSTRSPNHVS